MIVQPINETPNHLQVHLFDVLMDADSDQGDILLRVRGSNYFMCVELQEGAIDFVKETEMEPTRFVLSLPMSRVMEKQFVVTKMVDTKRVIVEYPVKKINNNDDESIQMFVKPPAKDYNGDKTIFYNTMEI